MGAVGTLNKPIKTREALDEVLARVRQAVEPRVRPILLVHPDADAAESLRPDAAV